MANLPFLDLEQRTGIKSSDIDDFLAKVEAVDDAIKGIKEGKIDPNKEIRIPGVLTESEKRQLEEKRREEEERKARLEKERKEKQKREEREKWWDCAELVFGSREDRARQESEGKVNVQKDRAKALSARYNNDYSRWDTWVPDDPVTAEEQARRDEEREREQNEAFEKANAEFCNQVKEDMKARDEAKQRKEENADVLRLKGNRFFKAKQFDRALQYYMDSLKASQFRVETLTNIAQVYLRLKSDDDAIEFCDRALHVCPSHVKALSRRAQAWSNRGEHGKALEDLDKAVRLEQGGSSSNEDLLRQHREAKQLVHDRAAEEAVSSIRTSFKEEALPTDVEGLERLLVGGSEESVEAMGMAAIDSILQGLAQPGQGGQEEEGHGLRLLAPLVASAPSHAVYLRTSGALAKLCAMASTHAQTAMASSSSTGQGEEAVLLVSVLGAAVESEVRNRLVLLREGTLKLLAEAYLRPSAKQQDQAMAELVMRVLASCAETEECVVAMASNPGLVGSLIDYATGEEAREALVQRAAALLRELVVQAEGRKSVLKQQATGRPLVQALAQQLEAQRRLSKPCRQGLVSLLTALAALPELRLDFVGVVNSQLLGVCRGGVDSSEARALALGALMNAGLEESGRVKEDLVQLGAVDLCVSLVSASDALRAKLKSEALWTRAAGLCSRLVTRAAGRARLLELPGGVQAVGRAYQRAGVGEEERGHLARVLAHVVDDDTAAKVLSPELVGALVRTLPEPRRDGSTITAETVSLSPATRTSLPVAVSVTKCLLSVVDKDGRAAAPALLQTLAAEEGLERLVCAFANASDGPLRRNIAGCLARVVKGGGPQADRLRELRFMEMMVQVGSRLVDHPQPRQQQA